MKRVSILLMSLILVLASIIPAVSAADTSDDSEISISVDRACGSAIHELKFHGAGHSDHWNMSIIGQGNTGYFEFLPFTNGEMSYTQTNLSVFNSTGHMVELNNFTLTGQHYENNYLFNSTSLDAEKDTSRLFNESRDNSTHYLRPYRHNISEEIAPPFYHNPEMKEFAADYPAGNYTGELDMDYRCEFSPDDDSTLFNNNTGEEANFSELDDQDWSAEEIEQHVFLDGLNISDADQANSEDDHYSVTPEESKKWEVEFAIVRTDGEGAIPDDVGEDDDINLETDSDAEPEELEDDAEIDTEPDPENMTEESEIDSDANETEETDSDIDTDIEEQLTDADPQEGDSPEPGQTPVPEPEPDPIPWLSVGIKPLNDTYEVERGGFNEIDLEVENLGDSDIDELTLEPRLDGNWDSQTATIEELEAGEVVNETVYIEPGEDLDPGMYQLPVYASIPDRDLDLQYITVEVVERISPGRLGIEEVPRDVRFEQETSNSIPVMFENSGETLLNNVQIELQNYENCGDYTSEPIEMIEPGQTASTVIEFETREDLEDCEATLVASSDEGDFAFSELNMSVRERVGVIPEEFQVPLVASFWTALLVVYAVSSRKFHLDDSVAIKMPLVFLVVGEVFILVYLSSTYYGFMPPGLLPF